MKKSKTSLFLRVVSAVMMVLLLSGFSAEAVHSTVTLVNGLRPVFSHPAAVQHKAGFTYAKTPLLRMPNVAYNPANALEEEHGEPVLVGEYETVYQTGEDSYKTVVDTVPNTYVDEEGQQVPIDNTLTVETGAGGEEVLTNSANALHVEMPVEIAEGDGVSVSVGNSAVRLVPLAGDYTQAAAAGDSVLYNDVFPGIDVQYTAHEVSLKEYIILRSPTDKNTFQYKLEAPGLEVRAEQGVVNLYNPGEQLPVFTVSAPLMYDAAGEYSFGVVLTLEGDVITIEADAQWLAAPERVYPIEIDPSVIETKRATAAMLSPAFNFYHNTVGYSVAGYIQKNDVGYPGNPDWGVARALFYFNDALTGIPSDAIIEDASFVLNQYGTVGGSGNGFELFQLDDPAFYADLDAHAGFTNHWDYLLSVQHHYLASFTSEVKTHTFDVTNTVSNWLAGAEPNYGLMVKAVDYTTPPAALFYSPSSGSSGDKPYLEINWREAGSVPPGYGLNATTVNVRPVAASGTGGQLDFYGVFWDGTATPLSDVKYTLNGGSTPHSGSVQANAMYQYPDSTPYEAVPGYPAYATVYRRKVSNWQTSTLLTNLEYDTLYTLTAHAEQGGTVGANVTSEPFLIYKVKQFDTLTSIANWYGVPYATLAYDNRVVDRLLVEGNTLFVRNPTKNATQPYNPEPLGTDAQREIDGLLMGRGLHCEFGYEPVNLNTGNFIVNAEDVSAADFSGDFSIERFYNSKSAGRNSMFGRGWVFNWDEKLSQLADGTISYARGDGSVLRFRPDGSGGYTAPAGYDYALERIHVEDKTVNFGTTEYPDPVTEGVYRYTITSANGTVKSFNSFGLLVQSTDLYGFTTTLQYSAAYKLERVVAPSGLAYVITIDDVGRITQIGLPGGGQLHYAYNGTGNLTAYTDATGKTTSYAYDAGHFMTSWTDANGTQIIENEYDAEGRVTKQTDARGETVVFAYLPGKTSITDMRGNVTVYHYDAQYRTTKIEYPNGTSEEKGYDANNRMAYEVDGNGNRLDYEYDAAGNITKITRQNGTSQQFAYNADNQLTQLVDWDGSETRHEYNTDGDKTKTVYPDGSTEQFEYDSQHRLIKSINALGHATRYEWNGALMTATIDPLGNRTQYHYDALGRITSTVDALGGVTRTFYDAAGRTTGEQDADGNLTQYVYDDAGRCIAIIDPMGYRTDFVYDGMDNLVKVIDPLGKIYTFAYDEAGNQLSETSPLGVSVSRSYDELGRLAGVTNTYGGVTQYQYDAAGRLIKETSPLGGVTTTEYDPVTGNVVKVTSPTGGVTTTQYDAAGRVVKVTDALGGVESYTYNSMGRTATHTDKQGLVTSYTYDAAGQLIKTEDNLGRVTQTQYDEAGRAVKTIAADGSVTETKYDKVGRAVEVEDALGGVSKTQYSAAGKVLASTNALGYSTQTQYDKNGNIIRSVDELGNATEFEYDPLSRLVLTRDALGGEVQTVYDAAGNVVVQRDVFGNETWYQYNAQGLPVKTTDALGNVTQFEYDVCGTQIKATAPNGDVSSKEYNAAGQLVKETTAAGLVTGYQYNAAGQQVKQTDSLGGQSSNTYNAAGQLVQSANALGQQTTYTYDKAGRQLSVTGPDGNTSKTAYDVMNRAVKTTDPEGNVTTNSYDALGRLVKRQDGFGRVWQYTYDALGRQLTSTDPMGNVSKTEYDKVGNTIKTIDAMGGVTSFVYDELNRQTHSTDALGNTTVTVYDAAGRVVKTQMPNGGLLEYEYDALGNVVKEMDALGQVTGYTYNSVGAVQTMKTPKGGVYTYSYSAGGLLASVKDPLGHTTTIQLDAKGRTVKETLADGGVSETVYDVLGRVVQQKGPGGAVIKNTYNTKGDLAGVEDGLGRVTRYEYDTMHRVVKEINPAGGITQTRYNKQGNVAGVTSPGGATTQYSYDLLDRVTRETNAVGGVTQYAYNALGQQVKITEPGGAITQIEYDKLGNVVKVTDALGQAYTFDYDVMSRLVKETNAQGDASTYQYDANGQLVKEVDNLGKETRYQYDKNGNMVGNQDPVGRQTQYVYDAVGNLVKVTDGTSVVYSYGYDAVGRLTSRSDGNGNEWKYSYDKAGNLTKQTNPLGHSQSYEYDVENQVVKSTDANGTSTLYGYDAAGNLSGKAYSNGQAGAAYLYDADGNLIRMRDGTGESRFGYDKLGRLVQNTNAQGHTAGYEYSLAGDLSALVYPDGSRVEYSYDALHRMVEVKGRDGRNVQYTYNPLGAVTLAKWQDGSTAKAEYDKEGRITSLINTSASGDVLSSFAYQYDEAGNITKETALQNGHTITRQFGYTGRGQLAAVRESGGPNGGASWRYRYNEAGNRVWQEEVTAEGTTVTKFEYDAAGRLVKSSSPAGETAYTYDAGGNLITQDGPEGQFKYEYTAENQLGLVRQNGTVVMAAVYDGLGNRAYQLISSPAHQGPSITEEEGWQTLPGSSSSTAQQSSSAQSSSVPAVPSVPGVEGSSSQSQSEAEKPPVGEQGGSGSLFWYGFWQGALRFGAGANQALGAERGEWLRENWPEELGAQAEQTPGTGAVPPTNWEQQQPAAGQQEILAQAGLSQQEIEQIEQNTPVRRVPTKTTTETPSAWWTVYEGKWYTYDLTKEDVQVLAEATGSATTSVYTYGTNRLTHETKAETQGYLYDGRGSVVQLTVGEAVKDSLRYNPYGEVLEGGELFTPFYGYNAEEHDPGTGLQYLRARYYAPELASFISKDTLGGQLENPLTQNLYLYTIGDPVNNTDPSGHSLKGLANSVSSTVNKVLGNTSKKGSAQSNNPKKDAVFSVPQSSNTKKDSQQDKAVQAIIDGASKGQSNVASIASAVLQNVAAGTNVLGTVLDMAVKTLSTYNRVLCSADAITSSAKRHAKNVGIPLPPGMSNNPNQTINKWFKEITAYMRKQADPRIALLTYVCGYFQYSMPKALSLLNFVNAPFGVPYPTRNLTIDDSIVIKVVLSAYNHYMYPSKYDYLGRNSDLVGANNKNSLDEITKSAIAKLHPAIRRLAEMVIIDAFNQGIYLRITQGYRSIEEQNNLYEQGRSKPGAIVTNAKGGSSYHNYGLAFDVVEIVDNVPNWECDWNLVGLIGKNRGFEWGGDWTSFVDRPHFQKTYGYTWQELLGKHNSGDVTNGYVNL